LGRRIIGPGIVHQADGGGVAAVEHEVELRCAAPAAPRLTHWECVSVLAGSAR
jgi:hypothetical protein